MDYKKARLHEPTVDDPPDKGRSARVDAGRENASPTRESPARLVRKAERSAPPVRGWGGLR